MALGTSLVALLCTLCLATGLIAVLDQGRGGSDPATRATGAALAQMLDNRMEADLHSLRHPPVVAERGALLSDPRVHSLRDQLTDGLRGLTVPWAGLVREDGMILAASEPAAIGLRLPDAVPWPPASADEPGLPLPPISGTRATAQRLVPPAAAPSLAPLMPKPSPIPPGPLLMTTHLVGASLDGGTPLFLVLFSAPHAAPLPVAPPPRLAIILALATAGVPLLALALVLTRARHPPPRREAPAATTPAALNHDSQAVSQAVSLAAPLCEACLEALPAGLCVVDAQGRILHANRTFAVWAGQSATALRGQPLAKALPCDPPLDPAFRRGPTSVPVTLNTQRPAGPGPRSLTVTATALPPLAVSSPQRGRAPQDPSAALLHLVDATAHRQDLDALRESLAAVEARLAEKSRALQDSETRIEDIAEAGSDWFWETGPDHRFRWFSDRRAPIDSRPIDPTAGLGLRRADLIDPHRESAEKIEQHMADLDAGRPFQNFVYWTLLGEQNEHFIGRPRLVRVNGKPMIDAEGRFLGYRGSACDITDQIEAEDRARRAESRLTEAINSIADGFALWDQDDRLVIWNRGYELLAPNLGPHLYAGMPFAEAVSLNLDARNVALVRPDTLTVLAEGGPTCIQIRMDHHRRAAGAIELREPDGRWILITERRTADGQTLSVFTDITQRKRTEMELAESEAGLRVFHQITTDITTPLPERLHRLLQFGARRFALPNGAITDLSGSHLRITQSIGPFFDVPEESLPPLEMTFCAEALTRSEPLAIGDAAADATWSTHPGWTKLGVRAYLGVQVVTGQRPTGTLCFSSPDPRGRPFSDGDKQLLKLMAQWVGSELARHQAENAMRAAMDQAKIANRSKSEFLANMSHELRTPLNAILGFSEVMATEVMGPLGSARYRDYARSIHDSGGHLLAIINDILDVSKIEAGRLALVEEQTSLGPLIDAAARLVAARAAESGVVLHRTPAPTLPEAWLDPRRMKQVFLNILSNAVKFTPEGGRISIDTRRRSGTGEGIEIRIADTGIGMTEDEVRVALTPFGQIDSGLARRHEGTGLGLPLARALVEMHGGTLSMTSIPGRGTTVTVVIPEYRLMSARATAPPSAPGQAQASP